LPQESGTGLSAASGVTDIIVQIFLARSGEVWKSSQTNRQGDLVKELPMRQWGEAFAFFVCASNLSYFICWCQYEVTFILHLIWWSNSFQLF